MQLRPQEIKNLTKAGMFVGTLLGLCAVFIFFLGKESSLFNNMIILKSRVTNVENLKVGAAVYLKGLKVGSVRDIIFKDLSVIELNYSVNRTYSPWVRKNSEVFIRTQGMLGDKYLEIDGGTSEAPTVGDGDTLVGGGASGMSKIFNQSESIMDMTSKVMSQLNLFLTSLNEEGQIKNTFQNISKTTENLNLLLAQIDGKKINQSINNLNMMSKRMEEMSIRMTQGPGTIHSLIYDSSVYDDLRTLLGGAQRSQVLKYFIRESIKKGTKLDTKDD